MKWKSNITDRSIRKVKEMGGRVVTIPNVYSVADLEDAAINVRRRNDFKNFDRRTRPLFVCTRRRSSVPNSCRPPALEGRTAAPVAIEPSSPLGLRIDVLNFTWPEDVAGRT